MYDEDSTALPKDENHLWRMIEINFEYARHILLDFNFESSSDALDRSKRGHTEGKRRPSMHQITYRHVSPNYDQRIYCYEMGRRLLPQVRRLIDKRELSPLFFQQWGKLMFCHGYIAVHLFDDSDDQSKRQSGHKGGSVNSKHDQKCWFAKSFNRYISQGMKPKQVHDALEAHIQAIVEQGADEEGFPAAWYGTLLVNGQLATTHHYSQFTPKKREELLAKDHGRIPPIPSVLRS